MFKEFHPRLILDICLSEENKNLINNEYINPLKHLPSLSNQIKQKKNNFFSHLLLCFTESEVRLAHCEKM